MSRNATTFMRRLSVHVRKTYHELDYAQRRMFELRTGVPSTAAHHSRQR
ncbi:MAG: hypothetical protein JO130_12395 [Solirubrobacterales bacterium]|nr:hypothetical protein [Solirubrobacterales bacterium]